jgi:hypothetical protein
MKCSAVIVWLLVCCIQSGTTFTWLLYLTFGFVVALQQLLLHVGNLCRQNAGAQRCGAFTYGLFSLDDLLSLTELFTIRASRALLNSCRLARGVAVSLPS